MPATAIQKNAPFQCRCTNGANRGRNLMLGPFVSVSLGFTFCGTANLPFKSALLATALCRGKLRRFSLPDPIVVFFTYEVEVPFLKLWTVPFFTNVDRVVLLLMGLCMRGCIEREGTLLATNRPPLAAAAGAASKSVRPTTAATATDTTIVVLISAAPSLRLLLSFARVLARHSRTRRPARSAAPGNELAGNELGRGLCPRRRPPPPGAQDPSASVPAELGAPRALRCWRASASASKVLARGCSMNVS